MPTLDELFPRGGAPTLSDNKDGKRAKALASVEVGLFGGSKSAGGEGAPQKRWRTVDDAPSGVVGDLMDDARLEVVAQGNAVVKAAKGKPARMRRPSSRTPRACSRSASCARSATATP